MLEARILLTLKFFGLQGVAPTLLELHRFLVKDFHEPKSSPSWDVDLAPIISTLDTLVAGSSVFTRRGMYALPQFQNTLDARWLGHLYGAKRERRIGQYVKFLRFCPFIRSVGLTGSQALGVEKPKSDIDLLIITHSKFMWLARILITIYFQIFGVRLHGKLKTNRFCLNHYVAGAKIVDEHRNWYTAFEYAKIRPLFGSLDLRKFQVANLWIKDFFPNWRPLEKTKEDGFSVRPFLEWLLNNAAGRTINLFLRRLQRSRFNLAEKYIIVEEDELSFHCNSKQDAFLESFLRLP